VGCIIIALGVSRHFIGFYSLYVEHSETSETTYSIRSVTCKKNRVFRNTAVRNKNILVYVLCVRRKGDVRPPFTTLLVHKSCCEILYEE
jgi:hypothetical protein